MGKKKNNKKKPGRNDPCFCGSGKKYKKCCLNKPNLKVDFNKKQSTQYFNLSPYVDEIYNYHGLKRDSSLLDLAKVVKIAVRNNADWVYDSFCHIDHPLIYEISKETQFRTSVISDRPITNTFLLYVAGCYALCKQIDSAWAQHVLKRVSEIHTRGKTSPKHFAACLAELEHIVLLKGHALNIKPLIPRDESNIRIAESVLNINNNAIGIEVCSVASFSNTNKMATQRLAEKICKELQPSIQNKRITLTVPESLTETILEHHDEVKTAIEAKESAIIVNDKSVSIIQEALPQPEVLKKTNIDVDEGNAVLIPGVEKGGTGERKVFYTEGLQIIVRLEREDKERIEKIRNALNRAVRGKIKRKQVDLTKYDSGLLAIRVPYEFVLTSQKGKERMKREFEEYIGEAQKLISHSSRYRSVLIYAASHQTKDNKRISMIRGQLLELDEKTIGKKYLEVEVGAAAIFANEIKK